MIMYDLDQQNISSDLSRDFFGRPISAGPYLGEDQVVKLPETPMLL